MDWIANHRVLAFAILVVTSFLLGGLLVLIGRRLAESRTLLPHVRVRNLWLRRALRDYPLYDPPHKIEERLLSAEQARENFDYFMEVRQQRLSFFRNWLMRYFRVRITLDENGMRVLNRWGNRYAGLLLDKRGAGGDPSGSYFTYHPPWTDQNAGYNALFDMGIALGEAMMAKCSRLHWALEPTSAVLPRRAKALKRSPGLSFQRPKVAGFDDPTAEGHPLHSVYVFAYQMSLYMITFKGAIRLRSLSPLLRSDILKQLQNCFALALTDFPDGGLRNSMPPEEYFKFVDEVEAQEEGGENGRP